MKSVYQLLVTFVGPTYARCNICAVDFNISHGGRNDVNRHVNRMKHKQWGAAASSSQSVSSIFKAKANPLVIEAEAPWAAFVAKHNLASDPATVLFKKMSPDPDIALLWSHKDYINYQVSPWPSLSQKGDRYVSQATFLDESNDKTDKSSSILFRTFDMEVGEVRTRFLDMPIVNIGTANNLFSALKSSLERFNLDFSNALAFMSDTTNLMKGARSGVQKLIRD